MSSPTIAIVGAGLSGLVLARTLQHHGMDCTVYKADPAADTRTQGGSLDIHEDSGQVALRAAGLYDRFLPLTHPGGEATRVLDRAGHVLVDEADGGAGGRPEVDRTALRDLLIDSITPGGIPWGRKVRDAHPAGGSRHELVFTDGTRTGCDLLIGADGARSKIRPLLSPARPAYCGITIVELQLADAPRRRPDLTALVGPGALFALAPDRGFLAHGGDLLWTGACLRVPADWSTTAGINWDDPAAARVALLTYFPDWDDLLTDLIRSCDTIAPRPIHALPAGHSWAPTPGVTLVGDAAHLMSPFAGEGANLALLDGADLARELLAHPDQPDTALTTYETEMFTRSTASAGQSAAGIELCFGPHSPHDLVTFLTRPPTGSQLTGADHVDQLS